MEAIQRSSGDGPDIDTMLRFGGVAMAVFGTGLLLSNRTVRQYLGQVSAHRVGVSDVQKFTARASAAGMLSAFGTVRPLRCGGPR